MIKMNLKKEIEKRNRKIENDKKVIGELKEEVTALRQLLDCAAAYIKMLANEKGGEVKMSSNDIKETLGKYRFAATKDDEGNYILKVEENE